MPVLIYMESAYRRADGTGVIRCEAMLPGDGQATISKVVRDTTARQMTREKLLLLAELLQNGVPDSNGERRKLRHVEILVYTTDAAAACGNREAAPAALISSVFSTQGRLYMGRPFLCRKSLAVLCKVLRLKI